MHWIALPQTFLSKGIYKKFNLLSLYIMDDWLYYAIIVVNEEPFMFFCDAISDFYISQEMLAQKVHEIQLMNSQSEISLEFIVWSSTYQSCQQSFFFQTDLFY